MKVMGFFVGTLDGPAEQRATQAGKSFQTFTLRSVNEGDQYPARLNCANFSQKVYDLEVGELVSVYGELSAQGYQSKTGKIVGSLRLIVKFLEKLSEPGNIAGKITRPVETKQPDLIKPTDDEQIPF
jgi:hypothetical protein